MPPPHLLPDRLAAVLAVVYLIFNEGYGGRGELAAEAIRLGRALAELMPDEPEVHGLLGADAPERRPPRGAVRRRRVVLLRDQDRSLWDAAQIAQGEPRSTARWRSRGRGPYVLQAALASLHAEEPPDWPQIAALYGELAARDRVEVVELNRAVAIAETGDVGRRAARSSTGSTSTATTTCTRPAPSCCAGSTAWTTRAAPTAARWSWCTRTPSGACWSAGSRS